MGIHAYPRTTTAVVSSGPCPAVVVAWGPSFGQAEELPIGLSVSMGTVEVAATRILGQTPSVPALALDATRTLGQTPSVPSLALVGQRTLGLQASVPLLGFDAVRTVGQAPTFPALGLTAVRTLGLRPSVPELALDGTRRYGIDIPEIVYDIPSLLAIQDTWVPEVALCPDDTNKNGTNLEVDGVAATKKDAYMQFKTDALVAAGQTCVVNSASLTINVTTAPLASTATDLASFINVTGTFDEATAICSTMPPASSGTGTAQSVTVPAATGELVITLTGDRLTRLATEMNNQRRTLYRFTTGNAATVFAFQSKDSGGSPGNAFGPRLAINFSIVNP